MQISQLTSLAAPYCPNLPAFVFETAFINVARDLFTRTAAWQETVDLVIENGTKDYALSASDTNQFIPFFILQVKNGFGDKLEPVREVPSRTSFTATPTCYERGGRHINLYPTPSKSDTYKVTIAIKPALTAQDMPDEVIDECAQALQFGTIASLKRQIDTDWYDPRGAELFEMKYQSELSELRLKYAAGVY